MWYVSQSKPFTAIMDDTSSALKPTQEMNQEERNTWLHVLSLFP